MQKQESLETNKNS